MWVEPAVMNIISNGGHRSPAVPIYQFTDHDVVCWKLSSDLVGGSYLGIRDSAHYKYDEAWLRDIFLCDYDSQNINQNNSVPISVMKTQRN